MKKRSDKRNKAREYYGIGLKFHGHKCPAMPMGLPAGLAVMTTLDVEHAQDKELSVFSETGKGHAAGCFLDGLRTVKGCTYGKSDTQKLHCNKMAFTLSDNKNGKSVRVPLKPTLFAKALSSPFVRQRRNGVLPQDVPAEILDPLIEKIMDLPEKDFLGIEGVQEVEVPKTKGIFEAKACEQYGELAFVDKLRVLEGGKQVCIPCSGYKN